MRKIIMLIGIVAALVAQAEPKFADLLAKAKAGDVEAMCGVARCYSYGIGVLRNQDLAAEWTQKAASNGCVRAIGICHENGYGTKEDVAEAMKWYRKAADAGDASAMDRLGLSYANRSESKEYVVEAKTNASEAVLWYNRAVSLGNASAMRHLGDCYAVGCGVESNVAKKVEWYHKAAEAGDSVAMLMLGAFYDAGNGVEQDGPAGVMWHRKAAADGLTCAMHFLASNFEQGLGCGFDQDPAEAVKWYRKLADMGAAWAIGDLGFFYYKGLGVEKDDAEALSLFQKAAAMGDEIARRNLVWLNRRGTNGLTYAAEDGAFRLHDLSIGWRYEAAMWCMRIAKELGLMRCGAENSWSNRVLSKALDGMYTACAQGKDLIGSIMGAIVVICLAFALLFFCIDWIVRLVRGTAVSDTKDKIWTSWWRLYSASPWSVKIATMICFEMLMCALVPLIAFWMEEDCSLLQGSVAAAVLLIVGWIMLHQVVRGGVRFPAYLLAIVFTYVFLLNVIWAITEKLESWNAALFGVDVVIGLFLIPFLLPSTRRWARAYREAKKELADGRKENGATGDAK